MKPCPIEAWVCANCGEAYVDDIEAAELCCDEEPREPAAMFGPLMRQRQQQRPALHVVR